MRPTATLAVLMNLIATAAIAGMPFGSAVVSEDRPGADNGQFIVPNEYDPHLFKDALKDRGGVIISVGSFRAINDAAMGEFSHLVMFDFDKRTVAFNKVNIALLAQSRDRYDYLSRLFNCPAPPELREQALSGKISDRDYLQRLVTPDRFNALKEKTPKNIRAAQDLISDPHDPFREINPEGLPINLSLLRDYLLELAKSPRRWGNSIFGSNDMFAKARQMALENRLHAMVGDLTGTVGMRSLSKVLAAQDLQVSAIDISNVVEYLDDVMRKPSFYANLAVLPRDEDAAILFTTHRNRVWIRGDDLENHDEADKDPWAYFVMPLRDFQAIGQKRWMDNPAQVTLDLSTKRVKTAPGFEKLIVPEPLTTPSVENVRP